MSETSKPHSEPLPEIIERLRHHAEQAIFYEEDGAAKSGMTPDSTWDEWQRGKDIISLIEQLETARAIIEWVTTVNPVASLWSRQEDVDRVRAFLDSFPATERDDG